MKNPKVGEKVRAYFGSSSVKGEVTSVSKDLLAVTDEDDAVYWFDRRQCVRLVPKKRRDFWIVARNNSAWLVFGSAIDAEESAWLNDEIIHVREVKP